MQDIKNAVLKNRALILEAERYIWEHPETGYKEYETSAYMEKAFRNLGYELTMADGITGFYTVLDTGKEGPTVLVLGELDSVLCPSHPQANPLTGAVHSCGHNAQCAALLGIAAALKEPGILEKFCGKIMLCAVPAEELLEIEFRTRLKAEGKIKYFGGKSEFLSRGYFDEVDMAFMVHASNKYFINLGSVGCIAKRITYKGEAAHAGTSPWKGKNALYAAMCGLNAANALRETFKEKDIIRFHPIMTSGGAIVNAVPEETTVESYVRGASFEAICSANKKVNQALCGAALSINTNIDIDDTPGYAPLVNDKGMMEVAKKAAKLFIPEFELGEIGEIMSGSTDMGDLSCIMPVIHPYCAGAVGTAHGADYYIKDPDAACVFSAVFQMGMLYCLLSDKAECAKEIIKNFKPQFASKEEFLSFVDELNIKGERIEYSESSATVKL